MGMHLNFITASVDFDGKENIALVFKDGESTRHASRYDLPMLDLR